MGQTVLESSFVRTFADSMDHGAIRLLRDRFRSVARCLTSSVVCRQLRSLVLCGLSVFAALMVVGLAMVHAGDKTSEPEGLQDQKKPDAEPSAKGTGRIWGRIVKGDLATAALGATVTLLLPTRKGQHYSLRDLPLRRTTSGPNGEFSFDGLAPGSYRVAANLAKLTTLSQQAHGEEVIIPEANKPLELRLVAGLAVTARVKDKATRKPIAGATVNVQWSEFPTFATTDRDGVAVLQPITAGQWGIEAWADGFVV
jgi:hypothetical protein